MVDVWNTLVDGVEKGHRLWQTEMFLPISMITAVDSLDEAMQMANNVEYGLTAGFYGSKSEADWFFETIEAGTTYANRPQGSTTGAWPGFQPFGGWKGSGSTGKNAGGLYYVPLYAHEQVQTRVDKDKPAAAGSGRKAAVRKPRASGSGRLGSE